MFLQFSAVEGRSLLCFEEVVLEDQQAVMGHCVLKNGTPWEEITSQEKLLASSLGNPKSAPLKGPYSAIYLSCFPQNLKLHHHMVTATKAVINLQIHDHLLYA